MRRGGAPHSPAPVSRFEKRTSTRVCEAHNSRGSLGGSLLHGVPFIQPSRRPLSRLPTLRFTAFTVCRAAESLTCVPIVADRTRKMRDAGRARTAPHRSGAADKCDKRRPMCCRLTCLRTDQSPRRWHPAGPRSGESRGETRGLTTCRATCWNLGQDGPTDRAPDSRTIACRRCDQSLVT